MRLFPFFLLVLLIAAAAHGEAHLYHGSLEFQERAARLQAQFPDQWMTQDLDHFNPLETRTFKQRYFVNDAFWKDDMSPIFIYIGGEGPLGGPPADDDEVAILAKSHGALLIAIEHRFYGKTQPFADFATENLRYLSSRQALADIASFITAFDLGLHPETHTPDHPQNKWIVTGGSYAGALSAWFRLKYPNLVAGSLSSSGVVHAILEFTAFDNQIYTSATKGSADCAAALVAVTPLIEDLLDKSPEDNKRTKELFGADSGMADFDFYYMLADSAAFAFQYGYTEAICDLMGPVYAAGGDLVAAFANHTKSWFFVVMDPNGTYKNYDRRYTGTVTGSPDGASRQWVWQKCSEVAYFQIAPKTGPRVRSKYITLDGHRQWCHDVYGIDIFPDTNATNTYYGGDNIQATRVVFTNGEMDPWQHATVSWYHDEPTSHPLEPPVYINCWDCGHCVDMRAEKATDPQTLVDARKVIAGYIAKWLA